MTQNILRGLAFYLAIMQQASFSADNTQQWWGAEIEGAPSIKFKAQQETALLNITDITGLGGIVRYPTVKISCSTMDESILASQQFLKIFANQLFVNDTHYECLPLAPKEFSRIDFLFSMNGQNNQNNPIHPLPLPQTTIRIDSHFTILSPLHDIIEIIAQNFRNNSFEQVAVRGKIESQYRWKLAQTFNIIMNKEFMVTNLETIYSIGAVTCAENIFTPASYAGDDYSYESWDFYKPTSIESFKGIFKKYVESYNNVKINSAYYNDKFEVGLSHDQKQENSCLTFTNLCKSIDKKKSYRAKYQLVLYIVPQSIHGLINTDF